MSKVSNKNGAEAGTVAEERFLISDLCDLIAGYMDQDQVKEVYRAYLFGAQAHEIDGIAGILYSVWAPNAERVSVVGDFNQWDGRCHPMRVRGNSGLWELFIPDQALNSLYKFEIRNRHSGEVFDHRSSG